jgi:hypothetical protein
MQLLHGQLRFIHLSEYESCLNLLGLPYSPCRSHPPFPYMLEIVAISWCLPDHFIRSFPSRVLLLHLQTLINQHMLLQYYWSTPIKPFFQHQHHQTNRSYHLAYGSMRSITLIPVNKISAEVKIFKRRWLINRSSSFFETTGNHLSDRRLH